jgi:hypothetical protein
MALKRSFWKGERRAERDMLQDPDQLADPAQHDSGWIHGGRTMRIPYSTLAMMLKAHNGQTDKGGEVYALHSIRVAYQLAPLVAGTPSGQRCSMMCSRTRR